MSDPTYDAARISDSATQGGMVRNASPGLRTIPPRIGPASSSEQAPERIRLRALVLGALSVAALAALNPYLTFVYRVWSVGSGSLLNGAVVVLLVLLLANGLLLRLSPRAALSRAEVLTVYAMMIVSVGLAMQGGLLYMVSGTTYPFYLAGAGNQWAQLILPNVPTWLQTNDWAAVVSYWEGLSPGQSIPWAQWTSPMLAWLSFTLALMGAMFCLGALLSRDWIERQRLTFPLVEVPTAMTGDSPRPSAGSGLLRSRIFWFGFSIPAIFAILIWLNRIFPDIPVVKLTDIGLGGYFGGMGLPWSELSDVTASILFPVIGVSCLVPAEVSLSLWLFYVLYRVQVLAWAAFGITEGGTAVGAINPRMFVGFEEAGGFIALTVIALYQSRRSLRAAASGLLGRGRPETSPSDPLDGRWALLGFLVCNAFMLWGVTRMGASSLSFGLLIGVFYAILVGASRLVAAGGVMYVDTTAYPRSVVLRTLGAARLTPASLTMYGYLSLVYMYDPMNLAMPQMMNSFKLLRSGGIEGHRWPWATALSVTVMVVAGWAALVWVLCTHGGANRTWLWDYPYWAFSELESTLRSPEGADRWLQVAIASGAAFTLLLTWLHTTFLWWQLSPIGFVIASSWSTNALLWASVFIGWAISATVRRFGGLKLYRQVRPAFLGLILGDYLTRAVLAGISAALGIKAGVSYGW